MPKKKFHTNNSSLEGATRLKVGPQIIIHICVSYQMVTVPLNLTDNDLAVEQPFTLSVLRPANNSNTSPFEIDLGGSANITVFIEDNDGEGRGDTHCGRGGGH